ncbi:TfoX/Sxy family protein [Lacipirellula sp.]|uniref:TfoX/Sxy family protein n=1 Tax=Lacipirellula sp. TaxID=2691419 RepID=UPI003D11CFC7
MAYDELLARRVRPFLSGYPGFSEKRMFGGMAYFLDGNWCIGIFKESMVVRVGLEAYEAALAEPHVTIFGSDERQMRGWAMVGPLGLEDLPSIRAWVERGVAFVETLPPKE